MEPLSELIARAQASARAGRLPEAESLYREALARNAECKPALTQLAVIAHRTGRFQLAEQLFRRALELTPASDSLHNNLGVVFEQLNRFAEAAGCYEESIKLNPASKLAFFNLGNVSRVMNRPAEAIQSYGRAIELDPDYVDALHNLGVLLKEQGRREEAELVLRKTVRLQPNLVDAHVNLGATLQGLGQNVEALASFREAQRLSPGYPDAVAGEASILDARGDTAEAAAKLVPLIEAGCDVPDVTLIFAGMARSLNRREEAVEKLQRLLGQKSLPLAKRQAALFALGKLLDALEQFEDAWKCYQEANGLFPRLFDLPEFREYGCRVMRTFARGELSATLQSVNESRLPIFVVGMPRSGTSLVEQILASHPDVFGAGELSMIDDLASLMPGALEVEAKYPDCMRAMAPDVLDDYACRYLRHLRQLAPSAKRVVDKMPGNFMHLGLIERLFPKAHIIHIRRHPLDTCISSYFQNFNSGHEFTYDLKMLGEVYRQYLNVMEHWRRNLAIPLFEIRYESLVENQESETRRLLEFAGLEWSDRCLRFHETKRIVRTASYDQVRQPMYSGSAGRWRRYGAHLGPLREALGAEIERYELATDSK